MNEKSIKLINIEKDIPEGNRIWCYYTNWAQYRLKEMKYVVKDMDISLCTHAAFAFAVMNEKHKIIAYEKNDEDSTFEKGMYSQFTALKSQNPKLKTYLSVGGWNFGADPFTRMAKTKATRSIFIESTIPFLRKYNFDGLDVDWEYPADPDRKGIPKDKEYFSLLIKELYEAYEEESQRTGQARLEVSIAAPAPKKKIDVGMDIKKIIQYIDYVNLMTYDFHGAWEKNTGHSSPLFPLRKEKGDSRTWNLAFSVTYWHKLGVPKSKLNIGIAFYGRTFTLDDPTKTFLGAPASKPGKNGTVTRIGGFLSYFESCLMKKNGGKRYYIDEVKAPYMVLGNQWLGYEDIESITTKVHWLREHGYSGIMIWTIDLDDYKDFCNQGKYPLSHAVVKALQETKDLPLNKPDLEEPNELNKLCFNQIDAYCPHWSDPNKYVYCDTLMEGIVSTCDSGKTWNTKTCVPSSVVPQCQ